MLFRNGPDLLLGQAAQREAHPLQLGLGQGPEDIALVLLRVDGPLEQDPAAAGVPLSPGVVPRGQAAAAQLSGSLQQRAEFDGPVAGHTGVRGASLLIRLDKGLHDLLLEGAGQVQGVMWDAQLAGDGLGILKVLQDVALFPLAGGQVFWDKQAHGNPHRLLPLLPEQPGGHRAVNSAAHRHCNGIVQMILLLSLLGMISIDVKYTTFSGRVQPVGSGPFPHKIQEKCPPPPLAAQGLL